MNPFRALHLLLALLLLVCTGFAAKPLQTRTIDLIPGPDHYQTESAINSATNKMYSGLFGSVTVTDLATRLVVRAIQIPALTIRALVANPLTNRIYVVGDGTELVIIDGNSDQLLTTVTLPYFGHFGIALDAQLNRLYISNYSDASVTVVDTATNQVLGSLEVVPGPWGVAVNSATHALYVASGGTQANVFPAIPGQVSVIDPTSNPPTLVAAVPAPEARGIAFNPTSNKIYVARWRSTSDVAVINAANFAQITTLGIDRALSFAVNPDPTVNQVYTCSPAGSSLITIDGATEEVDTAPGHPSEFRIHSVSANVTTGEIAAIHDYGATIFNSATGKVGSVAFAADPQGLAVNPVTGKMYVLNKYTNSVLVVNAATGALLKNLPLSGVPGSVIVNSVTNRIYVTTPNPGNITSIDGADDRVIYSRPVLILMERRVNPDGSVTERFETAFPNRMALDSTRNVIYVLQNGFVSEVDGAKEAPIDGFEPNPHWPVATGGIDQVGSPSVDIAYNAQTNLLYVAALTLVDSGQQNARFVASIIVKEPEQGPPLKIIFDPGQYDTLAYTDLELNTTTGLLYASGNNSATGVLTVKVIDTNAGTTQNSIVAAIPLSTIYSAPGPLALNPGLNRIYAFDGPPYPNSFGARLITANTLNNTRDAASAEALVQYNEVDFDPQTDNVYVSARDLSVQANTGGVVHVFFDGPDTVPPTGFVFAPAAGGSFSALLLKTGIITVSDLRSDIASAKVSLRNEQGLYWDGTQWVAGDEVFFDAVRSTGDWRFPFPTREQGLTRGAYTLNSRLTDAAGNTRSVSSGFNIIVPGAFGFTAAALSVDENAGSYAVTVNRTDGSDGVVELIYNVTDGTARNFESSQGATIYGDYVQPSQFSGDIAQRTLRFEHGETTKTFTIPINADNLVEGPQTVDLRLFNPTPGAELGAIYRAVLTINDNEPSPRLENVAKVDLIPGFDTHTPVSVAFNPTSNRIYVAGNNQLRSAGGFSTIDATTGVVVGGQKISAVRSGNSIAVDRVLNRVYVLQEFASSFDFRSSVQIFDGTSGLPLTEREFIPGTSSPLAIAVDSVRHKVYVASETTGGVSILDGQTGAQIGSVELGALTRGTLAVNETSNKIYASKSRDGRGEIFIVDGATGLWTEIEGSHYAVDMAVNNATDTTYILAMTEAVTYEILAIKGATNAVTVYPLNFTGVAIDVDASSGLLYVATGNNDRNIRVINAATGAEAGAPIPVGADQIAAAPGLNKLFLTGSTTQTHNAVGMVDLTTNTQTEIVTAATPGAVTAFHSASADKTYVADTQAPLIYAIDAAHAVSRQIRLPGIAQPLLAVSTASRVYFSWLTPRHIGETFTDQNNNFRYDAGEPFVDANGNTAYDPSGSQQAFIGAIDTSTDTIDPNVAIQVGPPSYHGTLGFPMAADEQTQKLYFLVNSPTAGVPGTLYSVDANPASPTFKAVQEQALGFDSFLNLAINPVSGRLYITQVASDESATVNILVLSASTLGTLATIPVMRDQIFDSGPFSLAVDSSSGRVYMARTKGSSRVYVIDGSMGSATENTIVESVGIQHLYNRYTMNGLGGLAVDSASHRVFVSDPQGDTPVVGLIEGGTTFTDTLVEAGAAPGGSLAFNAATQLLYSAHATNGTVQVLRNATGGQATLPAPTNLTFETVVPFTAGVPWTLSVIEASNASGLAVRFQVKPRSGTAWSDLPGTAIRSGTTWTLTTSGVPQGSIVFRAVASAPGFANATSEVSAPIQVFPGSGPITPVLTGVSIPRQAGKPWTFKVTADKRAASLSLQYSVDGTTFQDITGSRVSHTTSKWTLKNVAIPADAAFFRVATLTAAGDVIAMTNVRSIFKVDAAIAQVTSQAPLKTRGLIGRKVINASAAKQTKKLTLAPGQSAQFAIQLENASPLADAFLVQGPTGNINLLVQYFTEGGTSDSPVIGDEITASVVDGTYSSNVAPGTRTTIYLRATAISTTSEGVRTDVLLTAKSRSDATVIDTTQVRITVD